VSETCRVIINQVKQKLHLVGYLLIRYFKDARYHEHKILSMCYDLVHVPVCNCGSGSVAGIATAYRLDSPGIESRWGQDFPYLTRPALRPTQPPVQWVLGLSQG